MRYDFTAMGPGPLPDGFAGDGWALAAAPRQPRNATAVKAVDSPDYHVAFPSICKTLRGELLVVYREGLTHATSEDPHDGRIALIRSADGGRTWTDRVIIMDGDDYDDRNAAIACAPNGQLLVCWDKWKPPVHRGAFAMLSDDDGHSWSDPIRLQPIEDVHTRSPALMLKDGNWLIPLAEGEGGGQAAYATILHPVTLQSEMIPITPLGEEDLADEVCVTRTLTPRPPLPEGEGEQGLRPSAVLPSPCGPAGSDGRGAGGEGLVALGRHWHERTLWQTRSHDEGRTWEEPWLSSVPSQYCPADLITLQDARLVCSFSFRERCNERLVVSRDDGATWEVENSLDVFDGTMSVGGDRSYPASVQIDAETIGTVLYETQAYPEGGAIYFVRSAIADFDRPPVTALYAPSEGPSEGPSPLEGRSGWNIRTAISRPAVTIALPPDCQEIRLTYRFTGLFDDPPNRLELTLGGLTFGYQMGATKDRQGHVNWVDVNGEGHEAIGDWFDDGNEHELTLRRSDAVWTMSLDGHDQISAPHAQPPTVLSISAVAAATAIYSLEVRP